MLNNTLQIGMILLSALCFPDPVAAQPLLRESELIQQSMQENPTTRAIEAQKAKSHFENSLTKSQYGTFLASEYTYDSSREDAIIQFLPVFRPQKLFTFGVKKKIAYGAQAQAGVFSQQLSTANGMINNATQVGARINLEVDLWKNFLGKLDQSELRSKKISQDIAGIQGHIDQKTFTNTIRKIYWSLVGNELSVQLSQKLVRSAKKQLREANSRAQEGLGDNGDIARNRAQVQSREAAILFFKYQKEVLISNLKSQLPGLKATDYEVDSLQASKGEILVRQCAAQIVLHEEPKRQYSSYDKILSLLQEQRPLELKMARATDAMNIKVKAQYQTSGVNNSHGRAIETMVDQNKAGYQAGIALTIPLGSTLSQARESQVRAVHNQIMARKEQLDLKLRAEHKKTKKALLLLKRAFASQDTMVKSLRSSLKQTEKKYRQARIPLPSLILEQDNTFNAELQLIDTKVQTIHLLLDYFSVFPNYPCQLNKLSGATQ